MGGEKVRETKQKWTIDEGACDPVGQTMPLHVGCDPHGNEKEENHDFAL